MATVEELACVYSSMILQDGNSPVTAENISSLLSAADVKVEPYWPGLFAKALESLNLKDLVSNLGAGAGSAAAAAGPATAAAGAEAADDKKDSKKEAKKEEEEEEEDDDMGFGLFD